jgi:hypothetical protein
MNPTRIFALVITLGVLSTASVGQESQPPPAPKAATPAAGAPPAATPATTKAPQPGAAGAQAPAGSQPSAKTDAPPPAAAPGAIKDNEFIPTEELQPEDDVTFPVDI